METALKVRWQKASKQLNAAARDGDTPLDPAIRDTVIALQLLGYKTIGSCEGHLDHGTGGPWVNIMIEEAEELEQKLWRGRRRISKVEMLRINKSVKELANQHLRLLRRMLREFYDGRKVRLDLKLSIFNPGGGLVILESRGVNTLLWKNLLEPRYSEKLLTSYQHEMMEFTEFLKSQL